MIECVVCGSKYKYLCSNCWGVPDTKESTEFNSDRPEIKIVHTNIRLVKDKEEEELHKVRGGK